MQQNAQNIRTLRMATKVHRLSVVRSSKCKLPGNEIPYSGLYLFGSNFRAYPRARKLILQLFVTRKKTEIVFFQHV